MTAKTAALVKELAQLFVKYRLSDWAPVIEELETGGRSSLAQAVDQLATAAQVKAQRRPSPSRRKRQLTPPPPPPFDLRPERAPVLLRIHADLVAKTMLPSVGDLRNAFLALGIKGRSGATRADTARAVVEHLNALDDARFESAVSTLVRETAKARPGTEYQRWFDLIGFDRPAQATAD